MATSAEDATRRRVEPQVVEAMDVEQTGTTAVIGIRDEGPIARYLAQKDAREHVVLLPAVEEVFSDSADGRPARETVQSGISTSLNVSA